MLCQILKFVLPRVPLSIEHRRDTRPGHIVVDAGLNMIADGRSRGRNFGRGLLDRRDAPVAGRADREDEGQTRDCQTEQLPFDSHGLYLCSSSLLGQVRVGLIRAFRGLPHLITSALARVTLEMDGLETLKDGRLGEKEVSPRLLRCESAKAELCEMSLR